MSTSMAAMAESMGGGVTVEGEVKRMSRGVSRSRESREQNCDVVLVNLDLRHFV